MAFSPTSPITGGAQTGFGSPTFTIAADQAPSVDAKQYAVTALGGTQGTAVPHSVGSPFTFTCTRPRNFVAPGQVNPVTGQLKSVGNNKYEILVRKGAIPLAGQNPVLNTIRCTIDARAGVDSAAPADLRSMLSCFIGLVNQISASLGDTLVTGLLT